MKSFVKITIMTLMFSALAFSTNLTTTQAKIQPAKVVKTFNMPRNQVTVTHGYMYSNTRLTKRVHHLTNYRHTIFYTNKTVLLKKPKHQPQYYEYLKSKNGKIKGYVYDGFVKLYQAPAKAKSKQPKPLKPTTPSQSDTNQPQTDYVFSLADYRKDFLADLNQERTNRGLNPVTESTTVDQIAQTRSQQIVTNFTHYDNNHQMIASSLFKQANISYQKLGECLSKMTWLKNPNSTLDGDNHSAKQVADEDINNYIYHDEASNWGHKKILLDPTYTTIGIGGTLNTNKDHTFTAVDLYN